MKSRNVFVVVSLCLLIISGCERNAAPPTALDIELFYHDNRDALISLVAYCVDHESVKWIGDDQGEIDLVVRDSRESDAAQLRRTMKRLRVESISCTRDWSTSSRPLVAVTIPTYTAGLSVSGLSKGLKYLSEHAKNVQLRTERGELKAIGDGWYVYISP